jgi:hypothetical protein
MKFFYTLLFMIFAYLGQSQVLISILLGDKLNSGKIEFGLEGGWSLANLEGVDPSKGHSNYNLGFYFDFAMKNPSWFVSTGVRVKSTMGAEGIAVYSLNDPNLDLVFATGSVTRKLNYFNVPVMMKYMFKNHLYAQAGIQLGLRYKGTDLFLNTVNDKEDLSYKVDVKNQYHPLDGGLCAGLGYRLVGGNGMNIGVQYYYGLVDVRISDAAADEFNRTLYVNVGIPIGKGKAAAKAAEQSDK